MRRSGTLLAFSFIAAMLSPVSVQASEECAFPPCGWIDPRLDLDLEGNVKCVQGNELGRTEVADDCLAPPTEDNPVVLNGVFRYYWQVSEEGTYLNDPNDPIEVTFRILSGPSFIDFSIDPPTFTLTSADLYDPSRYKIEESESGAQIVWYWYEEPVTVTFTRDGEPNREDLRDIANKDGIIDVNLIIRADNSGERFHEGFALEAVRFHAAKEPQIAEDAGVGEVSTPGPATPLLLALLTIAAFTLRRRW